MMVCQAVIFDMDGVLVDTEELWAQAEIEVFSSLGVELTAEGLERTRAMTTADVTAFWYSRFPWKHEPPEVAEQKVVSRVIELIRCTDCTIEGVLPFIEQLKSRNLKIGLATNSPARVIPPVLQKTGLENMFDVVCSAEHEEKGKPHPAIYLQAARRLKTPPSGCAVVEDSLYGMQAAKSAGMRVVAFLPDAGEQNCELADHVITTFENAESLLF